MVNIKKDVKRVVKSSSVDPAIWEQLRLYSVKTKVPIARLLDMAIEEFLLRKKKETEKK